MTATLNILITPEQERLRNLIDTMWREEYPLAGPDLKTLEPFVRPVREEIVECTEPGRRSIRRISYYVLNDVGRAMYRRWLAGELDVLVVKGVEA